MKVKYDEYGDKHEENIDKYGDVIYKQKDCEHIGECNGFGEQEYWHHIPTGKMLIVPITLKRHWRLARREK